MQLSKAINRPVVSSTAANRHLQCPRVAQMERQMVCPQQHQKRAVFLCDEESQFYSECLEQMLVAQRPFQPCNVIEFGSGDGGPVLDCLLRAGHSFCGTISAFEINGVAASLAQSKAKAAHLDDIYQVHNSCFFEGARRLGATCLISNPPYIPAPDNKLMMPELFGGVDGCDLTKDLLSLGFQEAILLVAAISNPVGVLRHAQQEGYFVTNFVTVQLPFGTYSSEPKVQSWLHQMRIENKAFFGSQGYLLAGVQFKKVAGAMPSLSGLGDELVTPRLSSEEDSSSQHSSTDSESPRGLLPTALISESRSASNAVNGEPSNSELGNRDANPPLPVDKTDELLAVLLAPI